MNEPPLAEALPAPAPVPHALLLPTRTILKAVGSGLAVWATLLLWSGFRLFVISVLLAVTLNPALLWLERRGVRRGVGVGVIAAVAVGSLVAFVAFLLPPLTTQMTHLVTDFPEFRARIVSRIPTEYPALQDLVRELFEAPLAPQMMDVAARSLAWGQSAVSGLVVAVVVLVVTLYLLLDGRSLYAWLLAFVPRSHREKLATTAAQVSDVVQAYVSGQFVAALLFAVFTAGLLTILGVPAAAPLAVLAGLCDVVPVLGILIATLPALLLALSVSPGTAATVAIAYGAYHLLETYFLLPRIYGDKLKISTLAVLLALLVGAQLQGVIGAVLVLPLVAAYPIIERHWLGTYLRARVLTDHRALAKAAESGSDTAIDAVLLGAKHASEAGPRPGAAQS